MNKVEGQYKNTAFHLFKLYSNTISKIENK